MSFYWNHSGKYQKDLYRISKLIPESGYTDNINLNLLIASMNIYFDMIDNAGQNIKDNFDSFKIHLLPFSTDFKNIININENNNDIILKLMNFNTLEQFLDRAIELIKNKNLMYSNALFI